MKRLKKSKVNTHDIILMILKYQEIELNHLVLIFWYISDALKILLQVLRCLKHDP